MSLLSTPAILLRAFPYSETSTILRFYTRDAGVLGVMARGVRSRQSRGQGALATFAQGQLTVYHKTSRDLQTLRDFATENWRRELAADVTRFAGASVLGEVVLRHAGEEGNPQLFDRLAAALDRLTHPAGLAVVGVLLAEGWGLVDALGYRPELQGCVACGRRFDDGEMARFDFSSGGTRCEDCGDRDAGPRVGGGARAQLGELLAGVVPDPLTRRRAHVKLLGDFVTYHVAEGRPLQSLTFLYDLVRDRHA